MKEVTVITEIKTTPEQIISAFTELPMLRDWWGVERCLIEKRPGGVYTIAWQISETGFGYVSTGTIYEYNPSSLLVIKNFVYLNPDKPFLGPMTLTIKATANGSKTDFYLCQSGYQEGSDWDWYHQAVTQAWPIAVDKLKMYLER